MSWGIEDNYGQQQEKYFQISPVTRQPIFGPHGFCGCIFDLNDPDHAQISPVEISV